ncbi:hypothetical protein F5B20DRAFT_562757 [Whalleya microplaca]|nr:hypothetical protein F5B20DRAFT_562757 [Whalleya microplaca]
MASIRACASNSNAENILTRVANAHNLEPFWVEFEAKLPSLFLSSGDCKVEIVEIPPLKQPLLASKLDGQSSVVQWVSSLDGLNSALNKGLGPAFSRLFILGRLNSWSPIDITVEMFLTIYIFNHITPHFLKLVMGLGSKLSSQDEDFMSCYSQFSTQGQDQIPCNNVDAKTNRNYKLSADLCYNIRHFERHGRPLEDPWSCRQSAIHQKYNLSTDQSNWIVIHPPLRFAASFKRNVTSGVTHPMDVHIHYLSAGVVYWRDYLNYIAGRLKGLDEEITIFKPYSEFEVNFSSKQQVHYIQQKLHHARSILANTSNTIKTISKHEETVAKMCNLPLSVHQVFQRELHNISNELGSHKQTARKLLSSSQDIGWMYDDIMKFHGQELLHNNGLQLAQIAQNDSSETKIMTTIANKTYQDSRTTRIATVIAMFYLPANLVISFFSTTLVWFDGNSNGEESNELHSILRVHQETWIAVVLTLFLAACTMFLSWWWNRREKSLASYA